MVLSSNLYKQICNLIFQSSHSIDADENLVESEYEEDDVNDGSAAQRKTKDADAFGTKISWLLQISLENLGVIVSSYVVSICYFLCFVFDCQAYFSNFLPPFRSQAIRQYRFKCAIKVCRLS